MSEIAKLQIGEETYEFPVIQGTENELAIDVKTLRGATKGVITIDPGFKNTGSCKSGITFLDGEKGILHLTIQAKGRAGHSSRPWQSENALEKVLDCYQSIKQHIEEKEAAYAEPEHW